MSANLGRWIRRSATVANTTSGDILRWIWRYSGGHRAQGKVCAHITMSIPGGMMNMTNPGGAMTLATPGGEITIEDCD